MTVVLPAWDKILAFQPWSLACILFTKSWKSITLFPFNLNSVPKYLLGLRTKLTFRLLAKDCWMLGGILGVQNRSDFAKLMHWPDKEQYHMIIFFNLDKDCLSFSKKKIESSANKRCIKVTPLLPTVIPLIYFYFSAWVRAMDRMLLHNRNK